MSLKEIPEDNFDWRPVIIDYFRYVALPDAISRLKADAAHLVVRLPRAIPTFEGIGLIRFFEMLTIAAICE